MPSASRRVMRDGVATDPAAEDALLRGRTYAIPFDRVWWTSLALAGGDLRGWRVLAFDDQEGVIHAEARTPVLHFITDVELRIVLDENGQTRVDARVAARSALGGLGGAEHRRIVRFFRELDAALERAATPRTAMALRPSDRAAS